MCKYIKSQREFKRLALRSQKMADRLKTIQPDFQLLTSQRFESLIQKIDRLMLEETEDWLALISHAELYKAV